jgi:small subunit ribosomal protein S20
LAHSPRGWTGARTPSSIKRVRQTERRRAINQPRRSAAKTLIGKTLLAVSSNESPEEIQAIMQRAASALDRAAKVGAIHRNAAARRKSRLMLKVNAVLGGEGLVVTGKAKRTTGKTAAAKEARARIAAGRATKAKGAQTAAGKARAALARTSRDAASGAAAQPPEPEAKATPTRAASAKSAARTPAKSTTKGATQASGKTSAKAPAKDTARARAAKPAAEESATKAPSKRGAAKKS